MVVVAVVDVEHHQPARPGSGFDEVDGVRHDAGNKLGFLKATAYFALKRPDVSAAFTEYLKTLGFSR